MREPPTGLEAAGRALWAAVADHYDLDDHEGVLLVEAARTCDTIEQLVASAGRAVVTTKGRIRPELIELRQQRIVLARLLAALRVPLGVTDAPSAENNPAPRLQRRAGVRGIYALPGAS